MDYPSEDDVREALADGCRIYSSTINVAPDMPKSMVFPGAIIRLKSGPGAIKYVKTMGGGGYAEWRFVIMLIAGQVNEKAARKLVGELISPRSPLIRALKTVRVNGRGNVTVLEATKGETTVGTARGQVRCTCAELSVLVRA